MSDELEAIKQVENFIFDDKVQNIISDINNNLMDFNILEITGMGNQEIKHSNILGWLFDDSEHNLEYQILDNFLKKVVEENRKDDVDKKILDNLQSYIYLSENKKDITIYREKDNIDLLIEDEKNKVVITIENKVYANESETQLSDYKKTIDEKYKDDWAKYFIFLTIDLDEPSKDNECWMKSNHQMITDVIEDILRTKKDISSKTKIILDSYVDLLKRYGIVEDKILKELCEKIWNKEKYREAFEIIINNRPNKVEIIKKIIKNYLIEERINSGVYNYFLKFGDDSRYILRLLYNTKGGKLSFVIVTPKNEKNTIQSLGNITIQGKKVKEDPRFKSDKPFEQFGYIWVSRIVDIAFDDNFDEDFIQELIAEFKDIK